MAQIIKTTGEVIETKPNNGTDFSLEELQAIVGGYVEVFSLRDGRLICCDEEGKLKGKEHNQKATEIFQAHLVGDVLLCDEEEIK